MEKRRVALIGCGAVGSSFVYSAINQGLAQEYLLIDVNQALAEGTVLDLEDAASATVNSFTIKTATYSELKNMDIIVITAGRPQKPGETRLDMVADNARIMKTIAQEVKKSGFKGVTIIAANPVDIMTTVYQKVTGFDIHKVIGSGTILDTLRLKNFLGKKINVNPRSVSAYVIAEHGDSSFVPWSAVTVANKSIKQQIEEKRITTKDLEQIRNEVVNRAYEIIKLKRATFYGIGVALALLVKTIFEGQNTVLVAGGYLNGEYNQKGFYIGVPLIIDEHGWTKVVQLPLTQHEKILFDKSCEILKESLKVALEAIK